MRVFSIAIVAALLLAIAAFPILNAVQKSAAQAYHTSAARLDQQERVNILGREG